MGLIESAAISKVQSASLFCILLPCDMNYLLNYSNYKYDAYLPGGINIRLFNAVQ